MPDDLRNPEAAVAFARAVIADAQKPRVLIDSGDLTRTARAVQDHIAAAARVFDRDGPARLTRDPATGGLRANPMTPENIVHEAMRNCQPYRMREAKDGSFVETDTTLPVALAKLILAPGDWELPPLLGITSAPILTQGGSIRMASGYDDDTGLYCDAVPTVRVPAKPTHADAKAALMVLRRTFRTFPFADAIKRHDPALGVPVVDLDHAPKADESAHLAGLLTAVCRPSLPFAPGSVNRAPGMSGAGSGKGLLARAICLIAFGSQPSAITAGHDAAELDKRISSELMGASPACLLDNVNATCLHSAVLASVMTERPAKVRVMGESRMALLNSTAFIIVTGNGLSISEDLARRFITVELDPGIEDPESRPFTGDFLAEVLARRVDLLSAALTIWRWGQQHPALPSGLPLGSFGRWCRWVRDPLLALGCLDPVARIGDAKASDARRQNIAEVFQTWFDRHHDYPMKAADLHEDVRELLDPHNKGRQTIAAQLGKLTGTRLAGFTLTAAKPAGRWGTTTYAVTKVAGVPAGHEVVL